MKMFEIHAYRESLEIPLNFVHEKMRYFKTVYHQKKLTFNFIFPLSFGSNFEVVFELVHFFLLNIYVVSNLC